MKKLFIFFLLIACAQHASATLTFTMVSNPCDTNKVIAVSWTGGTSPYTVYWRGATTASTTYGAITHNPTLNTDTLFHYTGGKIIVQVYSGSTMVDSSTFLGTLPFYFTYAPNLPHCTAVATTSVTVTGGTPPFSYYWYKTNAPSTTVATGNPATVPNGYYGITIVDAAGCVSGSNSQASGYPYNMPYWDSVQATSTYTVSATSTPASCTNGTAAVTGASGGAVPPLNYLWSNGATSAAISGLTMGYYTVTVTDALGCVGYGGANITQTPTITAPITTTPATCLANDGGVIAFGSGGVAPYTYVWSNGATTQSQSGLYAGSYNVTATDANGCIGHTNSTVTSSTPITVTYATTPSLCTSPTGTATLTISGGTLPYKDTFLTSPLQTGVTATSLAPGTYSFRVVDAVGCKRTGSVIVPPINIITANVSSTPALCTLANGNINITGTAGGAAPYTYLWNTGATTSGISSAPAGYYSAIITDNDNCKITKSGNITTYSPVSIATSTTPASCILAHDGTASAVGIGGTAPYTYFWGGGGASAPSISSLGYGTYNVAVKDANGCYKNVNTYVGYNATDSSCFCMIKGTIYNDLNGNCVQDPGEAGLWNIQVLCSGIGYTYTDSMGRYSFIVPTGSYTITQTILAYYPLAACQSNNIPVTVSSIGAGCSHIVDFANTVSPIHDLSISAWEYSYPVPGNLYRQSCIITNNGTVTESNILAGYYTDGQLFSPTFLPAGTFNAGSATWYNTTAGTPLSLAPGSSKTFYLDYNVPTFIPMGTNLVFKDSAAYAAPISNWLTDYSPWNNVNYHNATVVSSYDPNFIEVSPQGIGAPGNITVDDSVLIYMVHFQNTGTYMAQNIVVIDTLDANLDWATLRPVYSSAISKVTLTTGGVLTYTFNNINLPPMSSEPIASNGMFTYTIKTKHPLPIGTQFKNKASIYFDYNAPIVTNTTLNTLWSPTPIAPTFIGGSPQNLSVCQNSTANSINTLLAVNDLDVGNTMTWSTVTAPAHGTLAASYTTTSTGLTLTPAGLTYAPTSGYSGIDAFTVQVTDGTATVTTTINVTVTALPVAGSIVGLNTVCVGASINLTDGTASGVWSSSNTTASVTTGGVVTGAAAGIAQISYTVTNSCGTAIATHSVAVNTTPVLGSISGPTSVCVGSSISLSNASSGGSWSSMGANASVTGAGVVNGLSAGAAIITYKLSNTCGTSSVTASVTVATIPSAGSITGIDTVCIGNSVPLSNTVSGGTWSASGIFASITSGGIVVGIGSGVDTIKYTVSNSCGSANTVFAIQVLPASACDPTGTGTINAHGNALEIYPNPNTGTFTIKYSSGISAEVKLTITNTVGEIVKEMIIPANTATQLQLNVAPGIYSIALNDQGKVQIQKLVIMK